MRWKTLGAIQRLGPNDHEIGQALGKVPAHALARDHGRIL